MDFTAIYELLIKAPSAGLIVIFFLGFWRRWWVFGWYTERLETELDAYKEASLEGTELASAYRDEMVKRRQHLPARRNNP